MSSARIFSGSRECVLSSMVVSCSCRNGSGLVPAWCGGSIGPLGGVVGPCRRRAYSTGGRRHTPVRARRECVCAGLDLNPTADYSPPVSYTHLTLPTNREVEI